MVRFVFGEEKGDLTKQKEEQNQTQQNSSHTNHVLQSCEPLD